MEYIKLEQHNQSSINLYDKEQSLLDNGLNYHFIDKSLSYTTTAVIGENDSSSMNSVWKELYSSGHILGDYTRSNFRNNGNFVTVTGATDLVIPLANLVYYNTGWDSGMWGVCPKNNLISATLTGVCGTVPVCSHLSFKDDKADFGILVNIVSLPLSLITNDKCLGWCARSLSSYRQDNSTGELVRWNVIFK